MRFYHKNHLDHVYAVSDKDGKILERYRYSPFGQIEVYGPTGTYLGNSTKNSAIGNTRTWNTRILDPDTNLYMYKYRHYHAALGRFMSRDPIGEAGGPNLYAFVGNNPLNGWDLLGLAKVEWIPSLISADEWEDGSSIDDLSLIFQEARVHVEIKASFREDGGNVWAASRKYTDPVLFRKNTGKVLKSMHADVDISVKCDDSGNISITPGRRHPKKSESALNAQVRVITRVEGKTAIAEYAAAASYHGRITTSFSAQIGKKDVLSASFTLEVSNAKLGYSDEGVAKWECVCLVITDYGEPEQDYP